MTSRSAHSRRRPTVGDSAPNSSGRYGGRKRPRRVSITRGVVTHWTTSVRHTPSLPTRRRQTGTAARQLVLSSQQLRLTATTTTDDSLSARPSTPVDYHHSAANRPAAITRSPCVDMCVRHTSSVSQSDDFVRWLLSFATIN